MTATEEVCRLLDERGVESGYPHSLRPELHRALDAAGIDYEVVQGLTFWNCSDGRECVAYGYQVNGKPELAVKIVGITEPEQAIAATLGPGTCHADETDTMECVCDGIGHYGECITVHVMECSECGRTYEHVFGDYEYCPHCRRRIEKEDE